MAFWHTGCLPARFNPVAVASQAEEKTTLRCELSWIVVRDTDKEMQEYGAIGTDVRGGNWIFRRRCVEILSNAPSVSYSILQDSGPLVFCTKLKGFFLRIPYYIKQNS